MYKVRRKTFSDCLRLCYVCYYPLISAKAKVQKILSNSPGSIWPVHSRKLDFRVNVNLFGLKNIGPASLTLACSRVAKALLDLEVIDLALKKLH